MAFVVVLAEELEERVAVRGLAAEVEVQYLLGCEGLLVHLQVAVDADDAGPHGVDVEVDGLAERGAGRGLAADGVPLIGEDTLADGGVGALAVDRDADAHGPPRACWVSSDARRTRSEKYFFVDSYTPCVNGL